MRTYVLQIVAFLGLVSCNSEQNYRRTAVDFLNVVRDQSIDSISKHFLINPSGDHMFPGDVKSAKDMLLKQGNISADSLHLDSSRSIGKVRRVYFIRLYNEVDKRNDYMGLIRVSFPERYPGKVAVFEVTPKVDNSSPINADSIKAEVLKRHGF